MRLKVTIAVLAAGGLAACASTELGNGGSMVQGSAGEVGNAQGQEVAIRNCDEPLGTLALVERQDSYALAQYGLESPVPLLRLMAAQSNCFAVVERGQALSRMQQERDLASSGMLQGGSNVGGGQMVAADYLITPFVSFSEDNAGGLGGALAGLLPSNLGALAGLGAGVQFREAQTLLTVVDQRTGVQIATAEGSARATDVLGGALRPPVSAHWAGSAASAGPTRARSWPQPSWTLSTAWSINCVPRAEAGLEQRIAR